MVRRSKKDVAFDISADLEYLYEELSKSGVLDRSDLLYSKKKIWEHESTKKLFATEREVKRASNTIIKAIKLLQKYT